MSSRLRMRVTPSPLMKSIARHVALLMMLTSFASAQPAPPLHRFEDKVRAYEEAARAAPPLSGAILLAGDSQFFRWKTLPEDLPDYVIINRGIDSFQMSDLVYYTDRLVLSLTPRMVILHVGGNDVHNGTSAEELLAEFRQFVIKVRARLPNVPIAFTSITPGPGRWAEAARRKEANRILKAYIVTQKDLYFIDLWDAMLAPDGGPREDLWVADRVHPNHAGYLLRVKIMRPLLGEPDKKQP
jgi:lysophospholipase L1-like esterase